jgi:3-phosphoshikimate 1-carboxyvinyltransferase
MRPAARPPARAVEADRTVRGAVTVPSSKSVSNRYLDLALLARQPITIDRLLDSDDIRRFRSALEILGFHLEANGDTLAIEPPAAAGRGADIAARSGEIHCGASGTLYRFLTAALTAVPGSWTLDGSPRLRERPIRPLVVALRSLGARIEYRAVDGQAPLQIEGGTLEGGETTLDAAESSQYASALLMAGAAAAAPVRVELAALSSQPYLELTIEALREFGVEVTRDAERRVYQVVPGGLRAPRRLAVEGDYSAATYPAVAALITGGSVTLRGLRRDSVQGDRAFFDMLESMGARVDASEAGVVVERARSGSTGGALRAVRADLRDMPDQVPTLAALAPFLAGTTEISGVPHLRIKESDRLAAMALELRRAGVPVRELPDGLVIEGCWSLRPPPSDPVVIDPHDDHRIAMALALVGLRRPGIAIAHPEVVGKSYPNFWSDLSTLLS